jgi:hypothetical protein
MEGRERKRRVDRRETLIEVSRNYFVQTQDGTVCYFDEGRRLYEGGRVVSHEGSWRGDGDPDHAPGIFAPSTGLIVDGPLELVRLESK